MNSEQSAKSETYSVKGHVVDMTAPYKLPAQPSVVFIEFGFRSPPDPAKQKPLTNSVFYVSMAKSNGEELATLVLRGAIYQLELEVFFQGPPPWNGISDPNYIVSDIKAVSSDQKLT